MAVFSRKKQVTNGYYRQGGSRRYNPARIAGAPEERVGFRIVGSIIPGGDAAGLPGVASPTIGLMSWSWK